MQKKLIPNLGNKTKYVLHYKNLQPYLSLGIKLTEIHRALQFKQSDWMKRYIDFNTEKRKNAAIDFEKDFFKLMINSVYGKTIENLWKRINLRLVNNEKDFLKYTSRPAYVTFNFNAELLFTDTDSLAYEIKSENVYKEFYKCKDLFDFSNHSKDLKFYDDTNKKVIGKMKD